MPQGLREAELGRHGDAVPAFLTALCGDKDDAVRAPDAENGGGSGVLEHRDVLNLIGVHLEEGPLHAVHKDERLGGFVGEGSGTPDVYFRVFGTGLAGNLDRRYAGDCSGKGVGNAAGRGLEDVVGTYG